MNCELILFQKKILLQYSIIYFILLNIFKHELYHESKIFIFYHYIFPNKKLNLLVLNLIILNLFIRYHTNKTNLYYLIPS